MTDETAPTPTPAPNKFTDGLRKWGPLLLLGVLIAKQFGWLTPQQADALDNLIPILTQETQKAVQEQAEKSSQANNQNFDRLADLIGQLVINLKPCPPQPSPDKGTPSPPVPGPIPAGLRIILSDETGKPISSWNVSGGQLFRVSSAGESGEIAWQPVKHGDVKIVSSSDGHEWFGYLEPGQWVDFGLTDYGAKAQTSQRIICNQGPQPPPSPDVVPEVKPQPPQPKKLSLAVVHGTAITPENAIVLNATDVWNSFITDYGCDWMFYHLDDSTAEGQKAQSDLDGVPPPALVTYDKATGKHVQTVPLPKSVSDLKATVSGMVGAK